MAEQKKMLKDPVHGNIEISSKLFKVIDTLQFQRLRNIKQLGACHFYYPGACHTRFEHSIGTYYLAGKFVRYLRDHLPEDDRKKITDDDVLAVELAALCHNLGYGPFSYMFFDKFIPRMTPDQKWDHKEHSCKMLDHLMQNNYSDQHKQVTLEQYFISDVIKMAKQLILPPKEWEHDSDEGKEFLYEIVCNKRNGVDVNQFDYFARDCYHAGRPYGFDHERFMQLCRVRTIRSPTRSAKSLENLDTDELPPADKKQVTTIAVHEKASEDLYSLFHTRNAILKSLCKNRIISVIEIMICDAMELANDYITIGGIKLSEIVFDEAGLNAFTRLDDSIFYKILHYEGGQTEMKEAKMILERILQRKLYHHLGSIKFPLKSKKDSEDLRSLIRGTDERYEVKQNPQQHRNTELKGIQGLVDFKRRLPETLTNRLKAELGEGKLNLLDIVTNVAVSDYGMEHKNPCTKLYFYKKENQEKIVRLKKEDVSGMLPENFGEGELQVFCRRPLKDDVLLHAKEIVDDFSSTVVDIMKSDQNSSSSLQ